MHIIETGNGLADISKALAFLENTRCLVGIPEKNSSRGSEDINNAELAFIHTNGSSDPKEDDAQNDSQSTAELAYIRSKGSPKRNIPPRPFIEPAIEQRRTQKDITKHLQTAAIKAIEGDFGAALAEMHKAGQYGENAVKDYIGSGKLTPNSEATIKRKGSDAPLIDTGSLRSSVTHVIEER